MVPVTGTETLSILGEPEGGEVAPYRLAKSPYLNYSLSCSSSSVDFFMV